MFHATKLKRLVFFLLGDVFIFIFSIYAAYLLRFNADIPDIYVQGLFVTAGFLIVFKLFFMWMFKIYKVPWRFFGLNEARKIFLAHVCSAVLFTIIFLRA